jgi:predicted RNA binding protein YcfA (HicA-like mRNA interferase family)
LEKLGFSLSRQSGSHKIYHNSAGNRAVGPYHAGKILHPKVLKDIISCTGLIIEEFESLLKDA